MADQRIIPWARRPYQSSGTAPNAPTGHTGNAFVPASDTQQHSQDDAFHPLPPGPSRRDSGRYPQNLLHHPGNFDHYPHSFNQNPQNFNPRSNVMAPRLVPYAESKSIAFMVVILEPHAFGKQLSTDLDTRPDLRTPVHASKQSDPVWARSALCLSHSFWLRAASAPVWTHSRSAFKGAQIVEDNTNTG